MAAPPPLKRYRTELEAVGEVVLQLQAADSPAGLARGVRSAERLLRKVRPAADDAAVVVKAAALCALRNYAASLAEAVLQLVDSQTPQPTRSGPTRCLDRCVHELLCRVIASPQPPAVHALVERILKNHRPCDTAGVLDAPLPHCLDRRRTWAAPQPTVDEEAQEVVRWVERRSAGFTLAQATERVKALFREQRAEGAKAGQEGYDVDETEMVTERVTIDLHCPLSLTRIVVPACSKSSRHLQPYDLEHFVQVNVQRNRLLAEKGKEPLPWQCPVTKAPLGKEELLVDPFFAEVLDSVPPSVRSITLRNDGSWSADEPPAPAEKQETYVDVHNGPFDPKYDIVVKDEPGGSEGKKEGKGEKEEEAPPRPDAPAEPADPQGSCGRAGQPLNVDD